jgi:hypothetical protein
VSEEVLSKSSCHAMHVIKEKMLEQINRVLFDFTDQRNHPQLNKDGELSYLFVIDVFYREAKPFIISEYLRNQVEKHRFENSCFPFQQSRDKRLMILLGK